MYMYFYLESLLKCQQLPIESANVRSSKWDNSRNSYVILDLLICTHILPFDLYALTSVKARGELRAKKQTCHLKFYFCPV